MIYDNRYKKFKKNGFCLCEYFLHRLTAIITNVSKTVYFGQCTCVLEKKNKFKPREIKQNNNNCTTTLTQI